MSKRHEHSDDKKRGRGSRYVVVWTCHDGEQRKKAFLIDEKWGILSSGEKKKKTTEWEKKKKEGNIDCFHQNVQVAMDQFVLVVSNYILCRRYHIGSQGFFFLSSFFPF